MACLLERSRRDSGLPPLKGWPTCLHTPSATPSPNHIQPEIGRFPSAASEPTLTQTINQSRGYDVRPGDKKE